MPIATAALLVSALVFAPLSSYLAGRRARSPLIWFALGVLIGPLAVVLLSFAPPGRCPDCGERVRGWPRVCTACGAPLAGAVAVGDAGAASGRPPERPVVVRTVGGPVVGTIGADGSGVVAPAATTLTASSVLAPTRPTHEPLVDATVRETRDRSWELAPSAAATTAAANAAQAAARGRTRDDHVRDGARLLGSAIFLGGSAPRSTNVVRLEVGDRYGLARDGDELQILGPVTMDPERIVARIPIAGAEVELIADRLVVQGGPTSRGLVVAFAGLATQRGLDVAAILGNEPDRPEA